MRPLPTGTLTFFLTDVEGSTARWERFPAAMGDAMRIHDAAVRAAIERSGGVIFKTGGDAFFAVFERSPEAIAAAIDMQTALTASDFAAVDGLHVRCALHVGVAEAREGDYFGPTLNRASRVLQAAHGGQVLVTSLVVDLTRDEHPPGAGYIDLGEYRLRDVSAPEHLFQLAWPGSRTAFPALRTGVEATNLPTDLTSIVGRDDELTELIRMLEASRLITIAGAGGVGKTSLALRLGEMQRSGYADGAWFVDLATIDDADLVISEFEGALGLPQGEPQLALRRLVSAVASKNMLLIVDNCEHVLQRTSEIVAALLKGAPGLSVIATSREPLRVAGELVYHLTPLKLPSGDVTPEEALACSAVALFVERARSVAPFALTGENLTAVISVCKRLDGLPYAIELAAARTSVLAAQTIDARLNERFRFLKSNRRDASPRQHTLYALIDWSYSLLDDRQRAFFRQLAIFPAGWTLAGAAAVSGADEFDVLEMIGELADKSLIVSDRAAEPRFRFLESTRDYARSALQESGEQPAAAAALFRFVIDYARAAEAQYRDLPEEAWIENVERESENVRAALEWSLAGSSDIAGGAELAVLLGRFWHLRRYHEGVRWLDESERHAAELTPLLHVRVLCELVRVDPFSPRTLERVERALAAARATANPEVTGRVLAVAAGVFINVGRYAEADSLAEEAAADAERRADTVLECSALVARGYALLYGGGFADAERVFRKAILLAERARRTRDLGMSLRGLALALNRSASREDAERVAREAIHVFEQLDDRRGRGIASAILSFVLLSAERIGEAEAYALESVRLLADARVSAGFCEAVVPLAGALAAQSEYTRAASLIGYVRSHWTAPFQMPDVTLSVLERTDALVRGRLAASDYDDAFADGAAFDERALARSVLQGRVTRTAKGEVPFALRAN